MRCKKASVVFSFIHVVSRRHRFSWTVPGCRKTVLQPDGPLKSEHKMATLESLHFDNKALRCLPIDKETKNYIRQVTGACFSVVEPTPVDNPKTVAISRSAMRLLDLTETELSRDEFADYFSGNKLLPGSRPAAHCYCGHQFGYFSGQLGDGAAMYLGEVINAEGKRWEIQFKGSGLTPYSRQADGRKVLRSTIREFLCSEAMHHLGVPTTRAGCCVTSDSRVIRDIFYDGHPVHERVSIVLRIAPTFIRFGSFEIFKPTDPMTGRKGPSTSHTEILPQLLDYTIETFFPEIEEAIPEQRYLAFFKAVVKLTARLVVQWQCVGFCHGVLNTDNMSIMGLTIDYGPFGFMDYFDPDYICNASDDGGRYTYSAQPEICKWNLGKLAEAISGALSLESSMSALEEIYDAEFEKCYMEKMRLKLGLLRKELPEDRQLVDGLLETMQKTGADFTNTFRTLSGIWITNDTAQSEEKEQVEKLLSQCKSVEDMKKACKQQMGDREFQMLVMLLHTSPNLLSQLGRGAAMLEKELERREQAKTLQNLKPEEKRAKDQELWTRWLSSYRSRLREDSEGIHQVEKFKEDRIRVMNSNNPRFILRNHIAQNAILAAEKGDFSEVNKVLKLLETPYSDDVDLTTVQGSAQESSVSKSDTNSTLTENNASASSQLSDGGIRYDSKAPSWSLDLRVT